MQLISLYYNVFSWKCCIFAKLSAIIKMGYNCLTNVWLDCYCYFINIHFSSLYYITILNISYILIKKTGNVKKISISITFIIKINEIFRIRLIISLTLLYMFVKFYK